MKKPENSSRKPQVPTGRPLGPGVTSCQDFARDGWRGHEKTKFKCKYKYRQVQIQWKTMKKCKEKIDNFVFTHHVVKILPLSFFFRRRYKKGSWAGGSEKASLQGNFRFLTILTLFSISILS